VILGRALAAIGRPVRRTTSGVLVIAAMTAGGALDGLRIGRWRRPMRAEFRRVLRQALLGGLRSALVAAVIVGFALVLQAVYWLGRAGQEALIGAVIKTVVIGEITPLLIGFLLLGRSGSVALIETAAMRSGDGWRALEGQGIDAFGFVVVPRMAAFALAGFTLAVLFVVVALSVGYVGARALDVLRDGPLAFLDQVLAAMEAADALVFPAKQLAIGALIATTACHAGLAAEPGEDPARLLPFAFVRGTIAILMTNLVLSAAA
jgi:phospholipid/cholesterol/gamma-HCH transport system permease protein